MDRHRVQQITAGQSYMEDVASAQRRTVLDSGAYSVTADAALAGFDIAVITVPNQLRDGVAGSANRCAMVPAETSESG
ncbi:hypothetical protein ACFWNR_07515 [Streptomyces virginiae]|uniref:hypothetical protein n=1 Tax=Streptomyces virginiae TaxID=1961 RepID=UPI0036677EA4